MQHDQKRLKQEYRQNQRQAGVFQIRNMVNGKVFVGSGLDLPGIMNRHRFELTLGGHRNKELQADWHEFGSANFVFEILDQLAPREIAEAELRADLVSLEDLWLEKLQPFAARGYNEPKLSREDKLRRMAAKRREAD